MNAFLLSAVRSATEPLAAAEYALVAMYPVADGEAAADPALRAAVRRNYLESRTEYHRRWAYAGICFTFPVTVAI